MSCPQHLQSTYILVSTDCIHRYVCSEEKNMCVIRYFEQNLYDYMRKNVNRFFLKMVPTLKNW